VHSSLSFSISLFSSAAAARASSCGYWHVTENVLEKRERSNEITYVIMLIFNKIVAAKYWRFLLAAAGAVSSVSLLVSVSWGEIIDF
jgi:hypothetical protein